MTHAIPKADWDRARAAAEALSNLNTYSSIVSMLEGRALVGVHTQNNEYRIVKICKAGMQQELKRYDRAMNSLGKSE